MRSRSCVDRASCLDSSVRSATRRRTTTTADHTTGQPTTLSQLCEGALLDARPVTDCESCSASARGVRPSRTATAVRGPRQPDLRVPEAAFPPSRPVTLTRESLFGGMTHFHGWAAVNEERWLRRRGAGG